jgi:phage baseplate assembly protein W
MGTPVPFVGLGDSSSPDVATPTGADPLGTDISSLPDLDPHFVLVSGIANLGQAIARRLETPRGGLFYDPSYGTDIRDYLNASLSSNDLPRIASDVQAEALKDPRVRTASASVTFNSSSFCLSITLRCQTVAGPFTLVLSVSQVTVDLLNATPTVQ